MNKKNSIHTLNNLYWVIKQIYSFKSSYLIISSIKIILEGIYLPISLLFMQEIINSIQLGNNFDSIFRVIVIWIIIGIFYSISINYLTLKLQILSREFSLKISSDILEKVSKFELSDFEDSYTYDLIDRAKNQGGESLVLYFEAHLHVITKIISIVSYLYIIATFKKRIVIILFIIPFLKYFITNKYNKIRYKVLMDRTHDQRKIWYISYLLTMGEYFKEIKLFGLSEYLIKLYKKYGNDFNKVDSNIDKRVTAYQVLLNILDAITNGFLFLYFAYLGTIGSILVGDVILYINSISSAKSFVSDMLSSISSIINDSLFIDNIIKLYNVKENTYNKGIKISSIESIEIKNLYFKYPNSKEYSIKNFNLKLNKGDNVVILGKNGSGKTTFIKLLLGFYRDYEGQILINGIDLKQIDISYYQKRVSGIFQDFCKYEGSIKENVGFGNIDLLDDEKLLNNTIDEFDFNKSFIKLERGINTTVGNWFYDGVGLSTGQWQLLALARAFFRNADMYVLDEPNASLDAMSEELLFEKLNHKLSGRISIIISHDIKSLYNKVDRIIIFDKGEKIADGVHEELIYSNKFYNEMFELADK